MKPRRILLGLLCVVLTLSLIACTNQAQNAPEGEDTQVAAKGDYENFDKSKFEGVTLNMYAVTDKVRPILDVFEEDTGIKVEHLTMKNGEILQRLKSENEAGTIIADLWFTGGADAFIDAANKGLLHPYISTWAEYLPEDMKDPDGYWHGTSLTLINFVVNKALIEEKGLKMPETWDDLLQEGLKSEVSMSNPASSGTAYNIVSAVLQCRGEEEGWQYIEKLSEQVPFFTPRGSDPAKNVVNGEAIVGINPSNGDRELEKQYEFIKLVYPKDGTGWWPQPVAIVEGTENLEAAKVFIDWVLSERGMSVVAEKRYAAVARIDSEIPEGIVDIAEIELFPADFKAGADNRDKILAEWKKRIEDK